MLLLRDSRSVNKRRPLTAGVVAKLLRRVNYMNPFATLFKVSRRADWVFKAAFV